MHLTSESWEAGPTEPLLIEIAGIYNSIIARDELIVTSSVASYDSKRQNATIINFVVRDIEPGQWLRLGGSPIDTPIAYYTPAHLEDRVQVRICLDGTYGALDLRRWPRGSRAQREEVPSFLLNSAPVSDQLGHLGQAVLVGTTVLFDAAHSLADEIAVRETLDLDLRFEDLAASPSEHIWILLYSGGLVRVATDRMSSTSSDGRTPISERFYVDPATAVLRHIQDGGVVGDLPESHVLLRISHIRNSRYQPLVQGYANAALIQSAISADSYTIDPGALLTVSGDSVLIESIKELDQRIRRTFNEHEWHALTRRRSSLVEHIHSVEKKLRIPPSPGYPGWIGG